MVVCMDYYADYSPWSGYRGSCSMKGNKKRKTFIFRFRTPSGARTLDPNIKSVVLYQLS